MSKRIYVSDLIRMHLESQPIIAITAYDYPSARLVESAGVHAILVGDSLGNVVQGKDSTLKVTLDEIIYHSKIVVEATTRPLVIADMPFLSYQVSSEQALVSAGRLIKEAGVAAVKLEGGKEICSQIKKITESGIPVIGHVGLLPQHVNKMGGYKIQGRNLEDARRIQGDALAVVEAGASAVVLEGIYADLAQSITESLPVPTIGIGAGPNCSGQILVYHDVIGYRGNDEESTPRFVKQYASVDKIVKDALSNYVREVTNRDYPTLEFSYSATTTRLTGNSN